MSWGANTSNKLLRLPNPTLWNYNLWDAWMTASLTGALQEELHHVGNLDFYTRWARPLMRAVVDMQRRGLLVDKDARNRFAKQVAMELLEVDSTVCGVADSLGFEYTDKFPNSEHQLRKFLFGTCGLKAAGVTPTGMPKVDQNTLVKVLKRLRKMDEAHRPLLLDLLHRTRLQTVKERYLTFDTSSDGRLRARVKMAGTKTFRFAYADPALQQFPMEVRHFFIAKPGHILISIDYSQLEARILAILSGDEISLEVFRTGGDVHIQNTNDMLGVDITAWDAKRKKAARNVGKGFLYRISYGGEGATDKTKFVCPCHRCVEKVPPMLDLTKEQILAAEARWFSIHHAVRRWQNDLIAEVRRSKRYRSPLGVTRMLSAPWGPEVERETKNIPMQMNAALLMNQTQVELFHHGAPICLQMHDNFVFEVPERGWEQRAADYRGIMERHIPELGSSFPADVAVGKNWGDFSAGNPDGLREVPRGA